MSTVAEPKEKKDKLSMEGMEFIEVIREEMKRDRAQDVSYKPNRIVGCFGILERRARTADNIIFWKISGHRKDRRHGALQPEERSTYGTSLLESMFKNW
jgi:hypothetical protein